MNVHRRDHVGRTPLHVAIISNAVDIACDLIDAGARITARLVDGRASLHLAAQMDQLVLVRKLLERSAVNAEHAKDDEGKRTIKDTNENVLASESDRRSSQDDWSSDDADGAEDLTDEDGEGSKKSEQIKEPVTMANAPPAASGDIPEDEADRPDILDINLPDWDLAFTPLMYAVLYGSLPVVEELLIAGADPKIVTKADSYAAIPFHPLTLSILAEDEDRGSQIAQRLLVAGASSSPANDDMFTIFHRAVAHNNVKVVSTLLRYDPNATAVLNFPMCTWNSVIFPVVTAISARNYSMLALMLAHGAKLLITEEDISRAHAAR
jgi:ankyrin repeat protein